MQSVSTGLSNLLASLDPDAAKMLRIAQNNLKYKKAVQDTWADSPDAAEYLLAHTNSIYFKKDETLRKGVDKDKDRFVLGVYLDDSTARAEVNARRELLRLALTKEGIHIDELLIHPATRGVKEHHLFPESIAHINELFGNDIPRDRPPYDSHKTDINLKGSDQSNLLETLKRAFCLAFGDFDQARTVLEKIEGAALAEVTFRKHDARGFRWYHCHLYVSEADVGGMKSIIGRYGDTIISRAKPLGLGIRNILIHTSPASIQGRCAFPPTGRPEPLKDLDLQELRSESARIAEEVRRNVRKNH
ncbi:MAG: hypothetical protein VB027_12240 [Gordonibacter sp.]|nr:hypothetical protein [Gordonibacter sp.]